MLQIFGHQVMIWSESQLTGQFLFYWQRSLGTPQHDRGIESGPSFFMANFPTTVTKLEFSRCKSLLMKVCVKSWEVWSRAIREAMDLWEMLIGTYSKTALLFAPPRLPRLTCLMSFHIANFCSRCHSGLNSSYRGRGHAQWLHRKPAYLGGNAKITFEYGPTPRMIFACAYRAQR